MSLQLCIHLAGIANFVYGIYFQMLLIQVPAEIFPTRSQFGGPWKYLTFLNLWNQLFYCTISLLNCLFGTFALTKGKSFKLQKLRDFYFATLSFPLGMFVGVMFWALYFVNRDLIYSEVLEKYIPTFENHVLHTTTILVPIIELCTTYHIYPTKVKNGIAVTCLACVAYMAWIFVIAYFGGFWVYPVLRVLSTPYRILFVAGSALLGGLFYIIGQQLNDAIWDRHVKSANKKN